MLSKKVERRKNKTLLVLIHEEVGKIFDIYNNSEILFVAAGFFWILEAVTSEIMKILSTCHIWDIKYEEQTMILSMNHSISNQIISIRLIIRSSLKNNKSLHLI
jgi:hypothetical protein